MLRGPEAGTDLPEVSVIPKIFHQVWLGPNPMPDEYLRYRDTWAQHHPEWEFRLWSEQNLPVTLQREEARDRLRVPAERADMLRLEVLLESGGVYIDTDMECLRSIEELIADVDLFVADSKPGHANECQKHTPGRSQSTIRLPSTTRSGSYALNASGSVESLPPNGMRSGTPVKNGSPALRLTGATAPGMPSRARSNTRPPNPSSARITPIQGRPSSIRR